MIIDLFMYYKVKKALYSLEIKNILTYCKSKYEGKFKKKIYFLNINSGLSLKNRLNF